MTVLYFPLEATLKPKGMENAIPISASALPPFADMIRVAIDRQMQTYDDMTGLMVYYEGNKPFAEKVLSAYPNVEEQSGILVGTVTIESDEMLSDSDMDDLNGFLLDLFDDEWGQGLREDVIETNHGELYVGFGNTQNREDIISSKKKEKAKWRKKYKQQQAREKIRAFVEKKQRLPFSNEWTSSNDLPSACIVKRLFDMTVGEYLCSVFGEQHPRERKFKWSADAILRAFDAFIAENGRLPKGSELLSDSRLPYPPTVQREMGMTPDELYDIRYPKFRENKLSAAQNRFYEKHGYLLDSIRQEAG